MEMKYVPVRSFENFDFGSPESGIDDALEGSRQVSNRVYINRITTLVRSFAVRIRSENFTGMIIFTIFCFCFLYTLLSIFTLGDVNFDCDAGISRILQERDFLLQRISVLEKELSNLTESP
jgi:hypothetical protein